MGTILRKIGWKIRDVLIFNPVASFILIRLKLDHIPKKYRNNWKIRPYDRNKSLQENVGYSHIEEIQKYVDETHDILKNKVSPYLRPDSNILDIGCGTGLFLKDFETTCKGLYGIDLNQAFVDKAKESMPSSHVVVGDYMEHSFQVGFDAIYCIGVFMYIPPSQTAAFFEKIYNDLNEGGVFFLQYTQALSPSDLYFPDLSYVRYPPAYVEKKAKQKFKIIAHHHFFDEDRIITTYDEKPYHFPGSDTRVDTVRNTYLLLLQK